MKLLIRYTKKTIAAFLLLYGVNLVIHRLDVIIPINLATVSTVTFLGVPGFITLFILFKII